MRNRLNQQQECALLNKLGEICQAVRIDRTRNKNIHTETDRTSNSDVTYSNQLQEQTEQGIRRSRTGTVRHRPGPE